MRTYTRKNYKADKAMRLNAQMKEDCMAYIIPRINEGKDPTAEDIRFAQAIFRRLLKQGLLLQ